MRMVDYKETARKIRRDVITMLHRAKGSFGGSAMSCVDILAVLFHGHMRFDLENPDDPKRDMFILSKGHASSALYAALASVGAMKHEELDKYGMNDTKMVVHPKRGTYPYVDTSTGALGHGICLATGSALAARVLGCDAKVYVLVGDGECNEGSIWENAAFASKQKLENLTVIVDRNGLQSCGRDEEVLDYGNMGEKFKAFGFCVMDIDGHDYDEINNAFKAESKGKPMAIIAKTVKGKGISYMEDRLEWHYKSPTEEQLKIAMEELGL